MYNFNPFRLAKQLVEADYQRLAKQDPREFSSEPPDDEDMADLRNRRSEDAIVHHHHQHLMHSLAASSPGKSEEERRMHKEEAGKHLKEKLALMASTGIKPQLSNDPKDVPDNEQNPVPFKTFNESQDQEIQNLLDIIEALSEELGIDSNDLFEGTEKKYHEARRAHKIVN
jgi:hypothetical protein